MIKKLTVIFLINTISLLAIASPVNIKIQNKTNMDATITTDNYYQPESNWQNWNCGDLCGSHIVKANTTALFHTDTTAFNTYLYKYTGIQTIRISYGINSAQAQIWIDHQHSVDMNIKTATIKAYLANEGNKFISTPIYLVSIGAGTNIENITTELYVEDIGFGPGTANVTFTLS